MYGGTLDHALTPLPLSLRAELGLLAGLAGPNRWPSVVSGIKITARWMHALDPDVRAPERRPAGALAPQSPMVVRAYDSAWAGGDKGQEHHLVAPPADHGAAPSPRGLALTFK